MGLTAALIGIGIAGGAAVSKLTSKASGSVNTPAAPPTPVAPAATPAPSPTKVAGTNTDINTAAFAAAFNQKKKAGAAVGRGDTILTGPSGLPGGGAGATQGKSLLGY